MLDMRIYATGAVPDLGWSFPERTGSVAGSPGRVLWLLGCRAKRKAAGGRTSGLDLKRLPSGGV